MKFKNKLLLKLLLRSIPGRASKTSLATVRKGLPSFPEVLHGSYL